MTTIPEKVLMEVANADLDVLYSHVRLLKQEEDNEEIDEAYEKIKRGINIPFNINYFLRGKVTIKEKANKAIVNGMVYHIEVYWDELEAREDLARDIIYKYMNAEEPIEED